MVIEKYIDEYKYIFSEDSSYVSIWSEEEEIILMNLIRRVFNRDYSNNECVRLDSVSSSGSVTELILSKSPFYSFLLTNFLLINMGRLLDSANESEKSLLERFSSKTESYAEFSTLEDVISEKSLSNLLAVSCVIRDLKNRVLLIRRNYSTGIADGFLSVSVTGSVEGVDLDFGDPVVSCCKRETEEELGFEFSPDCKFTLKKIVCGRKKLQPIALVDVVVPNLEDVTDSLKFCKGFSEENSEYIVVSSKEIGEFINSGKYQLTEAGRAHLETLI